MKDQEIKFLEDEQLGHISGGRRGRGSNTELNKWELKLSRFIYKEFGVGINAIFNFGFNTKYRPNTPHSPYNLFRKRRGNKGSSEA